jgi:hypothetical protein
MHQAKTHELEETAGSLNSEADDLKQELLRFGQKFLIVLYSPEAIGIRHLSISESRRSNSGKLTFKRAVVPVEKQMAEFLKKAMKRGELRTADAKIAAIHLLSLLESELLQRVLLGVFDSVKPEMISGAARRAVDAFISGYQRR